MLYVQVVQLSEDILMVGVFDGHGGGVASEYVCNTLENHINFHLDSGETKLTNVLHKAFQDVDSAFAKYMYHNYHGK